jgi:hypothetical protein
MAGRWWCRGAGQILVGDRSTFASRPARTDTAMIICQKRGRVQRDDLPARLGRFMAVVMPMPLRLMAGQPSPDPLALSAIISDDWQIAWLGGVRCRSPDWPMWRIIPGALDVGARSAPHLDTRPPLANLPAVQRWFPATVSTVPFPAEGGGGAADGIDKVRVAFSHQWSARP